PAAGAVAADADLSNATPEVVLTLTAQGEGTWANRVGGVGMQVAVDSTASSNPNDLFNLVVSLFGTDPRTGASVLQSQETFADLSMAPKSTRYVLTALASSALVTATLGTPAAPTVKGSSRSKLALPANVVGTTPNFGLRLAVDGGPPVDLTVTPTTTARDRIRDGINAALTAAGIGAAATLDGTNFLVITSTGSVAVDTSVTVLPAPVNDGSQLLGLGLTWGGTEVSGAAVLRPVDGVSGLGGGVQGGSDVAQTNGVATAAEVVPAGGSGGIYSLSALLFPRFNLLCLPDVPATDPAIAETAANTQALTTALGYCRQERAFLLVDTPRDPVVPKDWTTDPPALGGLPSLGEHGAVYFPRLVVTEPGRGGAVVRLDLPPSGAVAGVMARIDATRGVWKAPAGLEAGVVGASDLSVVTSDDVSGLLNPKGVNVLRIFPSAGMVVWGARTLKGDDSASSEFKYVPVRRLTDYIASSLYLGTQFAVFEPNDPDLWGQLRLAVGTFMRELFRQGAFQQSEKRAESDSFFVVCDSTVNPQSEIDLGRVNVVVGFAPLKPAEFVIVTITQISNLEA
ncbi:MAG TPA: phage tail sheath C-terminal domain-containing protein, partial [Acidimicrobiales bacterium]|nr:phage tail sheath C-terminal domain-containing protein [Acidimicrobiales bacterium]